VRYVKLSSVPTELVSGAEADRRRGVSREAIRLWRRRSDFPPPLARVGRSMAWDRETVADRAARTDRLVRGDPQDRSDGLPGQRAA